MKYFKWIWWRFAMDEVREGILDERGTWVRLVGNIWWLKSRRKEREKQPWDGYRVEDRVADLGTYLPGVHLPEEEPEPQHPVEDGYDGCPFPHCDSNVLHRPGACKYCDAYPKRQAKRVADGVNFTGETDPAKTACPSTLLRPLETIERWPGNRARRDT